MQKHIVTFLIILLVSLSFSASAETREDKISRLIEAQGFEDILNAQMEVRITESKRIGQEIMYSILDNLNQTEEIKYDFEKAHKKYLNKVIKPWTAKEITTVWADLYGSHFTDKELADYWLSIPVN